MTGKASSSVKSASKAQRFSPSSRSGPTKDIRKSKSQQGSRQKARDADLLEQLNSPATLRMVGMRTDADGAGDSDAHDSAADPKLQNRVASLPVQAAISSEVAVLSKENRDHTVFTESYQDTLDAFKTLGK
ncbi:hypothetical protein HDU93_006969 [Gonapodya sp. JEL0774]|nr:hypothetical protein HDU93_006969 [Gonapodya sp. JEL0774]